MDVPYPGLVLFEYFSRFMKEAFWIFDVGFQKWFLSSTILIFCLSAVPVLPTDVTLICFFTFYFILLTASFSSIFSPVVYFTVTHVPIVSISHPLFIFHLLFLSLSFFNVSHCCFCLFLHPLVPPFLPRVNVLFSSRAEVKKSADSIAGWLIIALHWLQFYI